MGVYLVVFYEQNQLTFPWDLFKNPWWRGQRYDPSDKITMRVTNILSYLIYIMRGDVVHVELYFDSICKNLSIGMKTNVAILASKSIIDISSHFHIQLFRLSDVTIEMENQLVELLTPNYLKSFTFSQLLFTSSAFPIQDSTMSLNLLSLIAPVYLFSAKSINKTQPEYCASLVMFILCQVLSKDHMLQSINRHSLSANDVFILCKRHLNAETVSTSDVYVEPMSFTFLDPVL